VNRRWRRCPPGLFVSLVSDPREVLAFELAELDAVGGGLM
jgi:hypothetical protein